MRPIILLIVSAILCLLALSLSAKPDSNRAEAVVLTEANWDEFVPAGKEVDTILGDIVLRNSKITAVIAKPVPTRNANMTVQNVGGCLIDLTSRSHESDQLSCFYPGGEQYTYSDWTVTVGEGDEQTVSDRLSLSDAKITVTVISEGNKDRPTVKTSYSLLEDDESLLITTEFSNGAGKTLTVSPSDRFRADGGKEWMKKSPNGVAEVFWIDDQFWQQAYALGQSSGQKIQSNSDDRNSTLKYLGGNGQDVHSIKPGQTFVLARTIAPGRTLSDAIAAQDIPSSTPYQTVQFEVTDKTGTPVSDLGIEYSLSPEIQGIVWTDKRGNCSAKLPVGQIELSLRRYGELLDTRSLDVEDGSSSMVSKIKLDSFHPGQLDLRITDGTGAAIPVKIEIVGQQESPTPDFGPETAEFAVKNLRYSQNGQCVQPLTPGRYLIRVSHGPEYSAEEFVTEIEPGKTAFRPVKLFRTVQTTGWVSSDFHSHSSPSGDNTSSQLGRVLNLVCEQIEFAPCTEHNRISTYEPHFNTLGIKRFISSVTGMELTGKPLPLNHQNAFPLHHHPHHQDGGGPTTDTDVETQVQRLAAWDGGSDKLIQQNHPDIGWLFYDRDGDGDHDAGHPAAVALIDVMEIHPIQRVLLIGKSGAVTTEDARSNRIFKWLQLINQGRRIPGVVNTDAHYNFHGSGWLRNWIQSSTDDPARIDPMEMVHASEEGRVVMSNGPFLTMTASSGDQTASVGQDLIATDRTVSFDVSVQCPNWFQIDTVFLLKNGRADETLIFTTDSHPELFQMTGEGAKRKQTFHKQVTLHLEDDTHVVAVAGGNHSTLGPVVGPQLKETPPAALTNPIFVDVDGDGFSPNQETLGLPLPIKGD